MFNELFQSLKPNSLLIAANNRLAARLSFEYERSQAKLEEAARNLQILPYNAWLEHCWRNAEVAEKNIPLTLLTSFQEKLIWEKILSHYYPHLHSSPAFINTAQQAWQLLQYWQVPVSKLANAYHEDHQFLLCIKQYQQLCDEQHLLDYARLSDQVSELIKQQKIILPSHIILLGFFDVTPNLQRLFTLLAQHTKVTVYHHQTKTPQLQRLALSDIESEIYHMARWAKQQVVNNANNLVGCIVSELNPLRSELHRIFTEVFSADSFNLSSGTPLGQIPIIYTALIALQLQQSMVNIYDIGHLLRSPFLSGAQQECEQRALLDSKLREHGIELFTFVHLLQLLTKSLPNCSIFHNCLQQYQQLIPQTAQLASQWAATFTKQLKALGWPGERVLTSAEFQAVQSFENLLNEFANLNQVTGTLSTAQAYHYLHQLTQQTLFQPQQCETSVQILGMVEAIGMPFTHAWIMGLDNRNWPAPAQANPLLPISLQRELAMPQASAQQQLVFSKRLTEQLSQQAKHVIFSYPQHEADQVLYASPLLNSFPTVTIDKLSLANFQQPGLTQLASLTLETIIDSKAPELQIEEILRGGSNIFKYQAACPFRAFAELRLQAKPLTQPQPGLNAKMRGLLLHKALEIIWQQLQEQKKLLQLNQPQLTEIIEASITQALHSLKYQYQISAPIMNLEKQRLLKVLTIWLELEKQRVPFKVIAQEQQHTITINNHQIRVQIDRIDQLTDGGHIIIDYKIGKPSIQDWFGERPNEPQLPLYTLTKPQEIQALLFAQLNSSEIKFKGITANKDKIPGGIYFADLKSDKAAASWQEQLTNWQTTLTQLFTDFIKGQAIRNPKYGKKTCEFCQLQVICRIHEANEKC